MLLVTVGWLLKQHLFLFVSSLQQRFVSGFHLQRATGFVQGCMILLFVYYDDNCLSNSLQWLLVGHKINDHRSVSL